jgi:hypothetical protein
VKTRECNAVALTISRQIEAVNVRFPDSRYRLNNEGLTHQAVGKECESSIREHSVEIISDTAKIGWDGLCVYVTDSKSQLTEQPRNSFNA